MTAQLSRERLEEIRDYDTCVTLEESAAMARMLLAGMDSEPSFGDHLVLIDKGRLMMLERSHQTLLDYRADSVWYWQGDEDDQPESLSCPVIMSAETLRELLAKAATPAPVAVPDKKESMSGSVFGEYYCDGWNACREAMLNGGKS